VDISKAGMVRERPLQAWADDIPDNTTASGTSGGRYSHSDDLTFGPGASQSGNQWDQFAVNEKLFGVKANFDEEAYTTKLDRNAPDFKEKEKKAAALANEIMSVRTVLFLLRIVIISSCYPSGRHGQRPYRGGTRHELRWRERH
jgi:PAB1-binding protein PBP1